MVWLGRCDHSWTGLWYAKYRTAILKSTTRCRPWRSSRSIWVHKWERSGTTIHQHNCCHFCFSQQLLNLTFSLLNIKIIKKVRCQLCATWIKSRSKWVLKYCTVACNMAQLPPCGTEQFGPTQPLCKTRAKIESCCCTLDKHGCLWGWIPS